MRCSLYPHQLSASLVSLTHSCGRTKLSPAQYTATGITFPITSIASRVPCQHGLGQQTTLKTSGTQSMPGLQPGCCIPPPCPAVGLSALSITKQHQRAPVAGGTSLKFYISQVFQNGSARNRWQLRHRHSLFSLCKKTQTVAKLSLQPLPAGSTIPS